MKVLVTGATGFIGQHVVTRLLERGHEVLATARFIDKARTLSWFPDVLFVEYDLRSAPSPEAMNAADAIVHLAWQGLPNYGARFHFEENLFVNYQFLKTLVERGIDRVLVTGTCLEYGLREGCLSEEVPTKPVNPYALAKDTLRKFLQQLQARHPFSLQWVRLFYLYGPGQNPNSLLAQLDTAIDRGDTVFNMSGGEQLRDYLPVQEAARRIVILLEHPALEGIVNCCCGKPISVRRLVENHLVDRNARIDINLGFHPYPDYEPMAFWGDGRRLQNILAEEP